MKAIHPEYHTINVKMTDGTILEMNIDYRQRRDQLCDIDPSVHPAWNGGTSRLMTPVPRFQRSKQIRKVWLLNPSFAKFRKWAWPRGRAFYLITVF